MQFTTSLIRPSEKPVYRAEWDPTVLREKLPTIWDLANAEREALGFLPHTAYRDAITRRRFVGMLATANEDVELVGVILYGGVFPYARIQQIVVSKCHRRVGVASALMNELLSRLEARGYLSVRAAVASDLPTAHSFYTGNGFVVTCARPGGRARNRQINVLVRDLETPQLFSGLEVLSPVAKCAADLGLCRSRKSQAPLYVIDVNVLFDITKPSGRPRAGLAGSVISAALAHQIRLAIAQEFIAELQRRAKNPASDPVLRLALQLPRLPVLNSSEVDRVASDIHRIVFEQPSAACPRTPQSLSDARHLAEAAAARASAYVTSDRKMLAARERILQDIGVDLISLEEAVELLPADSGTPETVHLKDTEISLQEASVRDINDYLARSGIPQTLCAEYVPAVDDLVRWNGRKFVEGCEMVALGVYFAPRSVDAPSRFLVHVRADHVAADIFADHLLDAACRDAASGGPATIQLPDICGQTKVRNSAKLRGFLPVHSSRTLIKVALGRPITTASWCKIANQLRRKNSILLPEDAPSDAVFQTSITKKGLEGQDLNVSLPILEETIGPTVIVWPGRDGVIVPITRSYAADLLGTCGPQLLFGKPEAAFLTRRIYFNTPRSAAFMRPGSPILFYESKRSGGRGAVIAIGRILDATVIAKDQVTNDLHRRGVVENLSRLNRFREVLMTTFDNLMLFPIPVPYKKLRDVGAIGSLNLQTANPLPSEILSGIIEMGWR